MYMQKLTKIKLTTNPKLTCIKKFEESWPKENDSCSKNESMKHTIINKIESPQIGLSF
jgi:hypothetical protein